MARGKYTEDGARKLCKGRSHPPGGEYVPLRDFDFHKSGRLKGRPFYVCKPCWNLVRGRDPGAGQISWEHAWPVINRLIEHFGSKAEVVRQLGRHGNWLYEIRRTESIKRTHFEEAKKLLAEIEAEERHYRVGEAEVVRAEPLGEVLRGWVREWLADRPLNTGMGATVEATFMGPISYLAEKTEINERRVSGIINGEYAHVGLSQADALLTAAGLWDLLTIGEIPIIPNPNWSMEQWQRYMDDRGCT